MGKLFNLKEWLTVADAAKHLSIVFGENITDADVLRLGLDGHFRLSVYFVNQAKARCGKVVGYEETEWTEITDIAAKSYPLRKLYETIQENRPIEERGKNLRIMQSLKIGGGRYFNLDGKEICINGVWDLVGTGQGQMDVAQKYQALISGPDVTDQALHGTFIEGPDGQTCELLDVDNKNLFCSPGGGLPEHSMLVVRTDALREFEASINGAPTSVEKPMTTTERNTLLTIIAALCDYSGIKYQERGAAVQIANMTQEIGATVTDDTIRKVLAKIPDALETRKK